MTTLQAGQQLSSPQTTYEIVAPLGQGGFGITWRARRTSDGREVVVKQLKLERVGDWKAVELFEREARVLQSLQHARIPACSDFFHQAEHCFLVQTLIPGQPLSALMRQGTRLDRARMMRWFMDVLDVLVYLHARTPPVIHRDINPKNIILEPSGVASLIDFGAVQAALTSGHSVASTSAGTFGYAPTEQFVGRATPQSDLYGLAMTFLAVQTGQEPEKLPFAQGRVQVRAALQGHDVDARVSLALEQMTDPDPERRPKSAREVLDRLQHAQTPQAAPPMALPPATLDPAGKIDWIAARQAALALGADGAWGPAPPFPLATVERAEVSPDGRAVVLITYEAIYLWHLPTQRVHPLMREEITGRRAGFSPDGQVIVITDTYNERILVATLNPDGSPQVRKVSGKALAALEEDDLFISVSPDRQSVLLGFDDTWGEKDNIALVDLSKGVIEAKLKAKCEVGLHFSPDGQAVMCVSEDDGLRLFGADGAHEDHKYNAFAFSPDGRSAAYAKEDDVKVTLASVESIYPLRLKKLGELDPRGVSGLSGKDEGRYEIERLRFSADGARLAIELNSLRLDAGSPRDTSWDSELVVADVSSRQCTHLILDPHSPDLRFDDLHSFAFTADGAGLLVGASFRYGRYSGVTHIGALLYALPAGQPARFVGVWSALEHRPGDGNAAASRSNVFINGQRVAPGTYGNVVIGGGGDAEEDEEDSGWEDDEDSDDEEVEVSPEARAEQAAQAAHALALFAAVKGDRQDPTLPFVLLSEGFFARLDRDQSIGPAPVAPYEDAELVRGVLSGKPIEAYLSPQARAALADVLLRRRIFEGLIWREELVTDGSWAPLVELTRGMTHLIPHIIQEARQRGASRPRFGQQQQAGGAGRVMASAVRDVALDLASRSAEEREVLWSQSEGACAALDAALARPPRVWALGRQPGKALVADAGRGVVLSDAARSGAAKAASKRSQPADGGPMAPHSPDAIIASIQDAAEIERASGRQLLVRTLAIIFVISIAIFGGIAALVLMGGSR